MNGLLVYWFISLLPVDHSPPLHRTSHIVHRTFYTPYYSTGTGKKVNVLPAAELAHGFEAVARRGCLLKSTETENGTKGERITLAKRGKKRTVVGDNYPARDP